MPDHNPFTQLMPGFDLLQKFMKGAAQATPAMGQWIAPTLDPEELEKRISELKTVQFWLEQNANMLGATIQALEVQRMTLNTLQTMNLPMAQLRDAMVLPGSPAPRAPARPAPKPAPAEARAEPPAGDAARPDAAPQRAVDPMQWWGALTQQFAELATKAVRDSGAGLAESLKATAAGSGAAKRGGTSRKTAAGTSAKAAPRKRR